MKVARDFLHEYKAFNLLALLNEAMQVAGRRANTPDSEYVTQARSLRSRADQIIKSSKFRIYPSELREILANSEFARALPERLASTVFNGFPDNKQDAIMSPELGISVSIATNAVSELTALLNAAAKFHLEEVEIPDDTLSLDITIPRDAFRNEALTYYNVVSKFADALSRFAELVTGSASPPTLVYTSTTDPVTAIAACYAGAYGFLKLVKLLLECAEKSLTLAEAIKALREGGAKGDALDQLEKDARTSSETHTATAVSQAMASVQARVGPERAHEIENALNMDCRTLLIAVSNGARVNLTVESLDRLEQIPTAVPGISVESLKTEIEEQRTLEQRVATRRISVENVGRAQLPPSGGGTAAAQPPA